MTDIERLRYPIGKFQYGKAYSSEEFKINVSKIRSLPFELRRVIEPLSHNELLVPYRTGGWNALQLVHHIGDSHVNGYLRMKFALCEENPVIKPYHESDWVLKPDQKFDIDQGVRFIKAVHERMFELLDSLDTDTLSRKYFHPEQNRHIPLIESAANYAHHGQHHLAHLKIIARIPL